MDSIIAGAWGPIADQFLPAVGDPDAEVTGTLL
jgi:hypothetical protein